MKIQTYEQRVFTAEEGHLLCHYKSRTISDKAYLGIYDNAEDWVEITLEEAEALQKQWEAEIEAE